VDKEKQYFQQKNKMGVTVKYLYDVRPNKEGFYIRMLLYDMNLHFNLLKFNSLEQTFWTKCFCVIHCLRKVYYSIKIHIYRT